MNDVLKTRVALNERTNKQHLIREVGIISARTVKLQLSRIEQHAFRTTRCLWECRDTRRLLLEDLLSHSFASRLYLTVVILSKDGPRK